MENRNRKNERLAVAAIYSSSDDEDETRRKKRRLNASGTSEIAETDDVNAKNIDSSIITWTSKKFRPIIHNFTEQRSGIQIDVSSSWEFIQYFQLFLSEELMEFVVEKTNGYWREVASNNLTSGTNLDELYCFVAISLLMTRNRRLSLDEYWSKNKLLRSNVFGEIMGRDRYKLLLRMLRFSDNDESNSDNLGKIRELIDRLRRSFGNAFNPYQNLCIDEACTKSLLPSKSDKFKLKSLVLYDCKSNYIQDFIVYRVSGTTSPRYADIGISGDIVMSLTEPYLSKGHTLYMDHNYASPALFNRLHANTTNACGTVRRRIKGMPRMEDKLKDGEANFRSSDNLLAMKWKDKAIVYMLSTMHAKEFVGVQKRFKWDESVLKPSCLCDYNKFRRVVDKINTVINTIGTTKKNTKWYKKYFFYMIDMCLWNAYCLYKLKTGVIISMAQFHLQLINQILTKYHKKQANQLRNPNNNKSLRLIGGHFPTPYISVGKNKLRRCVVCSKNDKRRESHYQCKECDVGLCVHPCFKIYHTQAYY